MDKWYISCKVFVGQIVWWLFRPELIWISRKC